MKNFLTTISGFFSREQIDVILRRIGFVTVIMIADSLLLHGVMRHILLDFIERITESSSTTNAAITCVLFLLSSFALLRR